MTKAQALALVNAIEGRKIPCDCSLRFDAQLNEIWSVQLDTTYTYAGSDLSALAAYCAANQLQLTATFSQLGVV